jgi:hypothetical protein
MPPFLLSDFWWSTVDLLLHSPLIAILVEAALIGIGYLAGRQVGIVIRRRRAQKRLRAVQAEIARIDREAARERALKVISSSRWPSSGTGAA